MTSNSTTRAGTPATFSSAAENKRSYRSYRLVGEYERPWVNDKRFNGTKWNNVIVYVAVVLGLAVSAIGIWVQARTVVNHEYCLIMDDQFTGTELDSNSWSHEIQLGGYNYGLFDWTTSDSANSYVADNTLTIVPTLTTESTTITDAQIANGFTVNMTSDGTCTSTSIDNCAIRSNSSTGAIIPPVRSARIITKGKKNVQYGKVEVIAKLPQGDWMWPAIWMLPEEETYGAWPRSGEMDIMWGRGNAVTYSGGRNVINAALHWGPDASHDGFYLTHGAKSLQHSDFTEQYHTFGIEWSETYLYMYRDSRLQQVEFVDFNKLGKGKGLWAAAGFQNYVVDGNETITDPWNGVKNAPFDQSFYLGLSVGVGGTSGWFADNEGGKPWLDVDGNAISQFYQARDTWSPTWKKGSSGMSVKSVKMWRQGKCA